jgi:serine/threonine-protein kinase HipA
VGKQNVLLVKRFDREDQGRIHFASARTLLIAEGVKEGVMGYADVAEAARRLSTSPKEDCHELFRRMVFNVFIENTDDHEKNHAFLFHNGAWNLSPAYDVLPQLQGLGFHQMRIGKDGNEAKISNLLSEYDRFLLKQAEAETIVADIHEQVLGWRDVFLQAGVSSHDIVLCDGYVLRSSVFQFGNKPEVFSVPLNQDYIGKIVAVDAQHAYQKFGRNVYVEYERAAVSELILPNAELNIRYTDGMVTVLQKEKGVQR